MKPLRLVCRNSRLSIVQANIAKEYILRAFPSEEVEIITIETSGDRNQVTPLYEMQGRDFFSKEIDDYLQNDEADIAVHSMKDLSGERINDKSFFGAVLERELPHDVAIFSKSAIKKLSNNEQITIGTSSLRRQELAPSFLKKALPFFNGMPASIIFKDIRGNVDGRLKKLQAGEFDGIVLAAAGLNRLLASDLNSAYVKDLLADTKLQWLPLMEVPPAPAQGALLAEALSSNARAVAVLEATNKQQLAQVLKRERDAVKDYGGGCHQQYGALAMEYKQLSFINISGIDQHGNDVSSIQFEPEINVSGKNFFTATNFMKDFFEYEFLKEKVHIKEGTVYVSHHRAVTDEMIDVLQKKNVFAAGSRTWFELAKKGIWCEGCADGFGFDFLEAVFKSPLAKINSNDVFILTNLESAEKWLESGVNAGGNYRLIPALSEKLKSELGNADVVFWTNFQQYEASKLFLKDNVVHLCPAGRTAGLLKLQGIEPILFPNIKTFISWHQRTIS